MGGGISSLKAEEIGSVYQFEKKLGEGSFAVVRRATLLKPGRTSATGVEIPKIVAVKTIEKKDVPEKELPLLTDEVDIMHKVHHENCVEMFEIFDNDQELHLVLEELSGGELFDRVVNKGYFNELEASGVVEQIAKAIQYLHSKGIVHRDLKPENVLFSDESDDATIKVTDFGLAKYLDENSRDDFNMKTACGTPGYVAPEVLSGHKYGKEVDLWSVGVILFILLSGYPPFYSENQAELFKLIKKADYEFSSPYWDEVSEGAKDVVKGLLVVDPRERLTCDQLLDMPWIKTRGGSTESATKNLGLHVVEGLKQVQAQQRWKQAKEKIVIINRLRGSRVSQDIRNSGIEAIKKVREEAEEENK